MNSATASLRIPQYRLHKSRGLAKVRLDGRDVYLGKYDSPESHAQYRRVIAEWLANAKVDTRPTRPDEPKRIISVDELLMAFLDHAKSYYVRDGKVTGEVQNLKYAIKPVAELYGARPVTEFGPVALKAVRQLMIEQDWCRSLVNGRVNSIRRVFRWGVENELVPSGVLHALQAVPGLKRGRCSVRETEPVKPVPDAIVDATCKAAVPVIAAMVRLQRLTGMRPGELVIMRTRDIDTTGKIWQYTPSRHKTEHHGKSRVIYLGPQAQRLLRPMLLNELDTYIFSPARAMKELSAIKRQRRKTRVQPSQLRRDRLARPRDLGEHYTTCSYARAIAYACDRAFPHPELSELVQSRMTPEQSNELDAWRKEHRWSPNQLRHSAATGLEVSHAPAESGEVRADP
ncbi:MAG: hypothetical protein U0573_12300 [Phycisphaerales bacterium]|nr:recombinase XerD [Planctomycetota bacterium]